MGSVVKMRIMDSRRGRRHGWAPIGERERERVRALGREDGNRITGVRVQSGM